MGVDGCRPPTPGSSRGDGPQHSVAAGTASEGPPDDSFSFCRRRARRSSRLVPGAATLAAQAPGTGISGSKHDFSDEGANTVTVGACTFCHTPHRAAQTRLLWNHTLSANTFSWDVTTTTGGTPYPTITTSWQGPSKFCLSCHDGSVAIGDVAWFRAATRTGGNAINSTNHNGDLYQIASATGSMANNHPVAYSVSVQRCCRHLQRRHDGRRRTHERLAR